MDGPGSILISWGSVGRTEISMHGHFCLSLPPEKQPQRPASDPQCSRAQQHSASATASLWQAHAMIISAYMHNMRLHGHVMEVRVPSVSCTCPSLQNSDPNSKLGSPGPNFLFAASPDCNIKIRNGNTTCEMDSANQTENSDVSNSLQLHYTAVLLQLH